MLSHFLSADVPSETEYLRLVNAEKGGAELVWPLRVPLQSTCPKCSIGLDQLPSAQPIQFFAQKSWCGVQKGQKLFDGFCSPINLCAFFDLELRAGRSKGESFVS